MGKISVIKMSILPKIMYLLQNLPIITNEIPFKKWNKDLSDFIWNGKKPRIKMKLLYDVVERGGVALPNLKLYYQASVITWILDWIRLEKLKLLNLEHADMIYGIHGYLLYDKNKVNQEFSNHIIRKSLLNVWKKTKHYWISKIPLWTSINEGLFRTEKMSCAKWPTYEDISIVEDGHRRLKSEEELLADDYKCNWFLYRRLRERFLIDQKTLGIGAGDNEFEKIIKEEGKQEISRIYKLLLKYDLEQETVKKCMIDWAKDTGQPILMEQWERNWKKRMKFTPNLGIRENLIKMQYRWHLTPSVLSKIDRSINNKCWKCGNGEGTYYHCWWLCEKAQSFWSDIHKEMTEILNISYRKDPKLYLLSMIDQSDETRNFEKLIFYMTSAARVLYAGSWKDTKIPTLEQWLIKLYDFMELDSLTLLLRGKSKKDLLRGWQPFINYLKIKKGKYSVILFED